MIICDFRADGAKPFADWRGLHDTRPFFSAPSTPCQASRARHGHSKDLQSSQPLCHLNPILYPDCPNPTVGLHCTSNCRRTSPSMKQCVLFTIRTPYVLVSPFVYRPSLSHIMLGTDIHPIPMSFLSGLIYTVKSDYKSDLDSQVHHPSAHISLPTLVGICAHLLKSWSLERTWINICVGYFW